MTELRYVEVNPNGKTYCSFPYYCSTDTSIVFKNLYLPIQQGVPGGCTFFSEGPGRFQKAGKNFECSAPLPSSQNIQVYFRNWQTPYTEVSYYNAEFAAPNGISGDLEIGNAYIKLDGTVVATGTTYTGNKVTLTEPFYFFDHFNQSWSNYIREGHCGAVEFYENGVLAAKYTPYLDDNNVAGFYDENNQTMIYSSSNNPFVAGPNASSIVIYPTSRIVKATGETITVNISSNNDWTAVATDGSWYTMSATAGTSADTAITITVPSYTGATDRQDSITFTDTATTDSQVFSLKQKKYVSGLPLYLGGDEITEIYLGGDAISEAYLGEDLVYSSSPEPDYGCGPGVSYDECDCINQGGIWDGATCMPPSDDPGDLDDE